MRKPAPSSGFPDNRDEKPDKSTGKSRTPWGERIELALGPQSRAWLAREAGISTSTLGDLITTSEMKAQVALRLARVLDVPLEWLVTGETPRPGHGLVEADQADWVMIPHFRLAEFTETGKPAPIETVPIRKDWLNRNIYTSTNLFITELPAHQFEGLGEEGDPILCRDAAYHNDEGFYLYFWDGVPIVRRFTVPSQHQIGEAAPTWAWEPEDPHAPRIVGRILANLKVRPV